MFTGIVEATGVVEAINHNESNIDFILNCPFTQELKVDQSLSHNGVCLTVEKVDFTVSEYQVTAIKETLLKTNLGDIKVGDLLNLERCMKADGRFDGHIVQGHVDQIGTVQSIENQFADA